MSDFDIREPFSNDPMTADEQDNLTGIGFEIGKNFHNYGIGDLLLTYRAAFLDGANHASSDDYYRESVTADQIQVGDVIESTSDGRRVRITRAWADNDAIAPGIWLAWDRLDEGGVGIGCLCVPSKTFVRWREAGRASG